VSRRFAPTKARTALHEAGHAVAALACGYVVAMVELVEFEDGWGGRYVARSSAVRRTRRPGRRVRHHVGRHDRGGSLAVDQRR
jgi:hypothetical protein